MTLAPPAPTTARTGWRRRLGRIATWSPAVLCGLWALVRLSGVPPPWPASALLALTPWVIPLGALTAIAALVTRNRWAAVPAATGALALTLLVVPRMWGDPDPRGGPELRVMTANLRIGGADPATVVRLVRGQRIDLLALQEYPPQARDALRRAGLDDLLPYQVGDPEPLAIGSALYARYPLSDAGSPVGPGGFVQETAVLRVPGAVPVAVTSVHPCAPFTPAHQGCWSHWLEREPRPAPGGPDRLLMGDVNATLDHPQLRRLIGSGYRDAADAVGAGARPTWPADVVPVAALDHVLADARIGVRSVSVHPVPDTDHRAVCAVLVLPRAGSG